MDITDSDREWATQCKQTVRDTQISQAEQALARNLLEQKAVLETPVRTPQLQTMSIATFCKRTVATLLAQRDTYDVVVAVGRERIFVTVCTKEHLYTAQQPLDAHNAIPGQYVLENKWGAKEMSETSCVVLVRALVTYYDELGFLACLCQEDSDDYSGTIHRITWPPTCTNCTEWITVPTTWSNMKFVCIRVPPH